MKGRLLVAMLAVFLINPLANAQQATNKSERTHYQCYLTLSDKSDVVHEFVSIGKTQGKFEAGLPGRMVYSADGVTGSTIETVYQCVKEGQSFKTLRARKLQEATPF